MPIEEVGGTRIFVRNSEGARQFLVYSMDLAPAVAESAFGFVRRIFGGERNQLAMVLPLPVPPRSPDNAVRFISLEKYSTFFEDLDSAFPPILGMAIAPAASLGGGDSAPKLVVHRVGSFDASFVPTLADFDRLDERFKLPPEVWAELPKYDDYGFAVFKLRAQRATIHPMALEFPRRDPDALFVPTVHVHDARVHPLARFDHRIYFQLDGKQRRLPGFENSERAAAEFMNVRRAAGIIDGGSYCYRHRLIGPLRNTDVRVLPSGVRLEGKLADAAYDGDVLDLAEALVSELLLDRAIDVDDIRRSRPHLPMYDPSWLELSPVEFTRRRNEREKQQRDAIDHATGQLMARVRNDFEHAEEIFSARAPQDLQHVHNYFNAVVQSGIRSALIG